MPPEPQSALAGLARPAGAFLAIVGVAFLGLGSTVQALDLPSGIWITQLGLFLLPAALFARACNLRPQALLGTRQRVPAPVLGLTLLASAGNYLVAAGLMGLLDRVLPESWHLIDAERVLGAESGARLAAVLVGVVVLAPVCEEAVFRGALLRPWMARLGPRTGIVLTAVTFSALHIDPIGLLPRLELGLFFGWLAWRTGSLWPAVLAHAVNNGTATGLYFVFGTEIESADRGPWHAMLYAIALGGAILWPAARALHRRTSPPGPDAALEPLDEGRAVGLRADSTELALLVLLAFVALGVLALAVAAAASGGLFAQRVL